jgi:hypothetical protein
MGATSLPEIPGDLEYRFKRHAVAIRDRRGRSTHEKLGIAIVRFLAICNRHHPSRLTWLLLRSPYRDPEAIDFSDFELDHGALHRLRLGRGIDAAEQLRLPRDLVDRPGIRLGTLLGTRPLAHNSREAALRARARSPKPSAQLGVLTTRARDIRRIHWRKPVRRSMVASDPDALALHPPCSGRGPGSTSRNAAGVAPPAVFRIRKICIRKTWARRQTPIGPCQIRTPTVRNFLTPPR